jgi:flagellar motor switch protein FliM
MGEQILSQVEVDALLKGLSNGEIATGADKAVPTGDVVPYDFEHQTRTIKGKMPTLEMINEKFCRNVRNPLFGLLRKTVDVVPDGIETMQYGDFLQNLQVPASLNVFQLNPLRGYALLSISSDLAFVLVDHYFGGDCRFHVRIEGRDFTNVEQTVIKRVVDIIFKEMDNVWRAVYPVEHKFARSEMNPQFVNIVAPSELVVVYSFKMEVESSTESFSFCVPYSILEPIKDKLYGVHQGEIDAIDKTWSENLRSQINYVPLTISVEIGSAEISVSDVLNLKVGDVIQLNDKVKDPVRVFVEGKGKYWGRAGVADNNYALQIVSVINGRG